MNKQTKVVAVLAVLVVIALIYVARHRLVTTHTAPEANPETAQMQDAAATPYPVFDIQNAKVGMKVGNFTLAEIRGEGKNKSYIFTGTSTVTGTYNMYGVDGAYFQTDKPFVESNQTVTIPNYSFEFSNSDTPSSLLHDGQHATIRITGYMYNGAIMASDGIKDTTEFTSVVK